MPTVPRKTIPEVRPTRGPVVFQSAAGATSEAFGANQAAGLIEAGRGLQQVSDQLAQFALKEQIEDNERRAKELDNEYTRRKRILLYGDGTEENPGFYSLRGNAAVDAAPEIRQQLKDIRRELLDTTDNSRVQEMFGQSSTQRLETELGTLSRFVIKERTTANLTTSQTRVAEAAEDAAMAYNNPDIVNQSTAIIRGEIFSQAEIQGWSPEVTQSELEDATTGMYSMMIKSAVGRRDVAAALEILEQNKEKMDPVVVAQLEADLQKPILFAEAQSFVDGIIGEGLSEKETYEQVRIQLKDKPQLRDEVVDRLDDHFARQDRLEQDERDAVFEEVAQLIAQGGSFAQWQVENPDKLAALSAEPVRVDALREYEKDTIRADQGFALVTKEETHKYLSDLSDRQLVDVDLEVYKSSLSRKDYHDWQSEQRAVRQALSDDAQKSAPYSTAEGIVSDVAKSLGLFNADAPDSKRSDDQLKAEQDVVRDMYRYIEQYQSSTGQFPNPEQMAEQATKFMTEVQVGPDFFENPIVNVFGTKNFDTISQFLNEMTEEEYQTARVDLDEVEVDIVNSARDLFRDQALVEPTNDELEQYIGAYITDNADRMDRIWHEVLERSQRGGIQNPRMGLGGVQPPKKNVNIGGFTGIEGPGDFEPETTEATLTASFNDVPEDIQPAITEAASVSGIDQDILATIAKVESNFDPDASNPNSSATGLFQFIDTTWNEMVNRHGETYDISQEDRTDARANAIMGGLLTKENSDKIEVVTGRTPTARELYLAHFAGIKTALEVIRKIEAGEGDQDVSEVFSSAEIKANPTILKGTIQEAFNRLTDKVVK